MASGGHGQGACVRSMRFSSFARLNSCRYFATLRVDTSPTGAFFGAFLAFLATTSERIFDDASPMRSERVEAIMRKTRPHTDGSCVR